MWSSSLYHGTGRPKRGGVEKGSDQRSICTVYERFASSQTNGGVVSRATRGRLFREEKQSAHGPFRAQTETEQKSRGLEMDFRFPSSLDYDPRTHQVRVKEERLGRMTSRPKIVNFRGHLVLATTEVAVSFSLVSSSSPLSDGNSSLLDEGGNASQVSQATVELAGYGSVVWPDSISEWLVVGAGLQ